MSFVIEEQNYSIITSDVYRFPISLDIIPALVSRRYINNIPKLTVDSVEVAVKQGRWNASPDSVGIDCGFTLWDVGDKAAILAGTTIKFEVGVKVEGVNQTLTDDFNAAAISPIWIPGTIENVTQSGGQLILDNGGTTDSAFIETEGGSGSEYYHFYNSKITFEIDSLATGAGVLNEFAVLSPTVDIWIDIGDGAWTIDGTFSDTGAWDAGYTKLQFFHNAATAKIGVRAYEPGAGWTLLSEFDDSTYFDDPDNRPLFSVYVAIFPDATPAVGTLTLNRVVSNMLNDNAFIWTTIADNQRLATWGQSLDGQSFSFSTVANLADKFNTAPLTDLMIYDPAQSPFDASQVEPQYDTAGNTYPVEDFPIEGLTRQLLCNEIFVERLGFSAAVIPDGDAAIKQKPFPMGVSYWESIKDLFGSYSPSVYEIGTVLYIRDSTVALPEGFTAPDLTIEGCLSASLNAQYSMADHVLLSYTADEWDIVENEPHVSNDVSAEDTNGFTYARNIIRNYHVYKHHLRPNVVVKRELQAEFIDVYRNPGLDHFKETILTNEFDAYGRIVGVTRVNNELVPDLENEGEEIWKENVTYETVAVDYAQHPYNFASQYQQKISRISTGLVTEDTDNPYFGQTAKQGYRDAHRSLNLQTGQTYAENKSLKTLIERFEPSRDGQVKRDIDHFDNVRGVEIDYVSEPRAGDVSLNGSYGKAQTTKVLPTDASVLTTGVALPFAVGELPLDSAIPLARRVLAKAQDYPINASLVLNDVDKRIRRGFVFQVKDLSNTLQGTFVAEGYSGEFQTDQTTSVTTWQMQVEASQVATVPDAEISSYSIFLSAGETLVFQREFNCFDGYQLTSETVSDLTVEARESGVGSYTNIETGSIDLSPFAGTTQDFDIRLTAGTTTTILYKDFDLIIARP